jgi:hypothetical protein
MTRIRVSGTVDSAIAIQVDLEHDARVLLAKQEGRKEPCYSATIEDLLKKGLIRVKLHDAQASFSS